MAIENNKFKLLDDFAQSNFKLEVVAFPWFECQPQDGGNDIVKQLKDGVWKLTLCGKNAGTFSVDGIEMESIRNSEYLKDKYLAPGLKILHPFEMFREYFEVIGTQVLEGAKPSEIDYEDDFYSDVLPACGYDEKAFQIKFNFPSELVEEYLNKVYYACSAW